MILEAKRAVIFIVEDELLVRMNVIEMIEEAGFEVVEAASLEGRLDITIVFTDIQRPGSMDGSEACCCGSGPPAAD